MHCFSLLASFSIFALQLWLPVAALDGKCAPGGNFKLTKWKLQLPIGAVDNPNSITGAQLDGCSGWQDPNYFFTNTADGSLVMKVPELSKCVTTKHSEHCRTELREQNPSSWSPKSGTNRLKATLKVPKPDDSNHGTVVGQIHIDDSISKKPVCELYYSSSGVLTMGVSQNLDGHQKYKQVGTVAVGKKFTYEIRYENNQLSVIVEGVTTKLDTFDLNGPKSYFKVGNYNQGTNPSEVVFYSIEVSH